MHLLRMLIVAALAACAAPQSTTESDPPASASGALPAPTPADIPVRISAGDAGATVQVAVSERFAIELVGVPTAGYVWEAAETPAFVVRRGEAGGPTNAAQREPGFTGGNHWEVTIFEATAAGVGVIRMVQRRPWETDEAPVAEFTVTIDAR